MRLTCPNCGAQYEVPDEVIPPEGRDVQCSNCGDTWYQAHPSHPEMAKLTAEPEPDDDDDRDAVSDHDPAVDDDADHGSERPVTAPRKVEPEVSDILREEARREAQLRASEADALESQPDLGLDSHTDDEAARRAREARDRMARMRGQQPAPATPPTDPGSRRGLLPDIEEINSTLRSSGDASPRNELGPVREQVASAPPRKSGFMRGFAVVVIIAVVLGLIYANAQRIAETVPQADPMLSAYVALVDQARVWLDAQASGLLPPK